MITIKNIRLPLYSVIAIAGLVIIEPTPYLLVIISSVTLHEAGHLLAMRVCSAKPGRITVLPLGIDIEQSGQLLSYPKEIIISSAGPLVNILIFLLFGKYEFFACTNLLYALLNLLPVKGLDGSNIFKSALLCFAEPCLAEGIALAVSFVFSLALWMLGIYLMLVLNGNISVFALSVFLFISTIIKK